MYGSEAATSLCQLYRCRISGARCCLLIMSRANLITRSGAEKENPDVPLQPADPTGTRPDSPTATRAQILCSSPTACSDPFAERMHKNTK